MAISPAPRLRLDSEARRRRIVDAALPLFARKGFAGTTTKEIAEAAEVSEALLSVTDEIAVASKRPCFIDGVELAKLLVSGS